MAYFIIMNLDESKYLYNPYSQEFTVDNIELSLELGEAGALTFDIYKTHPYYNDIKASETLVTVFKDELNINGRIFDGQVREIEKNIDGSLNVYCVGELAYLLDSIQRQREFHGQPNIYVRDLLQYHNLQVAGSTAANQYNTFKIGTFSHDDDYIYRFANYQTTLDVIREDIVESLGVYPKIVRRYDAINAVKEIQFYPLDEYGQSDPQWIEFGVNLMDYVQNETVEDLYTAVLPLGRKKIDIERDNYDIDALDAYVTVREVNGGSLYIKNDDAVDQYGFRCALEQWDDIDVPSVLLKTATEWLQTAQYKTISLQIKAIDLAALGANVNAFQIGDQVRCLATPLGIDITLPLMSMKIYPQAPENNIITLGAATPSLTRQTIQVKDERQDEKQTDLIDWASDHQFSTLTDWTGHNDALGPNWFGTDQATVVVKKFGRSRILKTSASEALEVISLDGGSLPDFTNTVHYSASMSSGWSSAGIQLYTEYDKYNGSTDSLVLDTITESVEDAETPLLTTAYVFDGHDFSVRAKANAYAYINFSYLNAYQQTKTLPWHTYNYYNGTYITGVANIETISRKTWLTMTGEIMARATLPWADLNDAPSKLYAQFSVFREEVQSIELVDQNGNYLVDENGNILGNPGVEVLDSDVVLELKWGNYTRQFTHEEISTSTQRLTIDISEGTLETALGPAAVNTYLQHLTIFNHAPYKLYITDFHLYGDADVYYSNPWAALWAF